MADRGRQAYLACERRWVYMLLMISSGIIGAHTYVLRGGVFCNAQTGNVLHLAMAIGEGQLRSGLYYLVPVIGYVAGTVISELTPRLVRRIGLFRWDTYLVAIEAAAFLSIGFIPLSAPHQISQVIINFMASMQYNTFRQAEGIAMSTTFCTNHARQLGVSLARIFRKHERKSAKQAFAHLAMIACFVAGAAASTMLCHMFGAKSIWLSLLPLGIVLVKFAYADLTYEHNELDRPPAGH